MSSYVPPELKTFVDQVGDFIEYWGFKNVQGRIWAHIYLSSEPLDAAELMKRLDVSKGLISISLKDMLQFQVIEEAGKSDRGTIVYRANPNQRQVIFNVLRQRERMMMSRVSTSIRVLDKMPKKDKEKMKISSDGLGSARELVDQAESFLDIILASEDHASEVWSALANPANFKL